MHYTKKRKSDFMRAEKHTHDMSKSKLFYTWCNMRHRCLNFNRPDYQYYGGRGITVCSEWEASFNAFKDWAFNNGYQEGLTIDRIDVNGNYEPTNCRWVTRIEQANNMRTNLLITVDGITKTAAEWGRVTGVKASLISERIRKGWPPQKAIAKYDYRKSSDRSHTRIKIVNIPKMELFSSMKEAAKHYHYSSGNLSYACKSKARVWRKFDDFIKENGLTEEEAYKKLTFIA